MALTTHSTIPQADICVLQVPQALERIMQCKCSLDWQPGSLIGVAISKLLDLYTAAAETNISHSGSYQMRGLDTSAMRSQLVTHEAEIRVRPLLNLFKRRFCAAKGPDKATSKDSLPIARHTERLLREKLRLLIQQSNLANSSNSFNE